MENKGFPQLHSKAIKNIIFNPTSIIDIEGDSKVELQRGMRQGDSISPSLFSLAVRTLQRKMRTALKGMVLGNRKLMNLFFADDWTVILRRGKSEEESATLDTLLKEYGRKSRLVIKDEKVIDKL
ncbi:uncharacterized protein [Lepeophtheirus salmonis]|uniref:uncharacterized protein n=1 Tax=Lepeophtheirus salmonis TaxID=72036 RepID=UPI001AE73D12|nr:uncharacterized protein LOC121128407 [Lepeophtheirus salmonis]